MNILFDNLESLIDAPNGIEKARELILQLAIQGKLTEQDPKDEPASELLKKTKKEKEKLIAEGKIKKQNEPPPIKEEEKPFELPKGWEWCRMDDLGSSNIGLTYSPNDIGDKGLPVLRSNNIQNGNIVLNDLVRVSKEVSENVLVHKNDLLICARNGSRRLVGKCALINELSDRMAFGAFMAIFRSKFNRYIKLFLESPLYRSKLEGVETTTINQITQGNLRGTVVPLPPLAEQKRIVEKVNSLMALLDELKEKRERRNQKRIKLNNASLEKLLTSKDDKELKTNWKRIEENFSTLYSVPENVEKLKQAILQLAVQGKLVQQDPKDEPASELLKKIKKEKDKLIVEGKIKKQKELPPIKDDEKPFELPKGWEWVRLGDIGLINPRNDIPDNLNVSFIPMALISENYGVMATSEIRTWGEIKKGFTHFANDDVGLAKITPCFENGKAAVFRNLSNGFGAGTTELHIFRKIVNNISSDFIYILIKTPFFVDGGKSQMTGTAGQQRVSKDYFQNYVFALPPSNEQKIIVEKVNELMSLCNTLEEKLIKKEETAERLVGAVVNRISKN